MSPGFLHDIVAPQLHDSFMDLITLWMEKSRLGKGRPFSAKTDVYNTALEAIWAAIFGIEETATITREQINLLNSMKDINLPSSADEEVDFPQAPTPPGFDAILKLTDSLEHILKSPFPRLTGYVMLWIPSISKRNKLKNSVFNAQIAKAEKRMAELKDNTGKITNGIDHMLRREYQAAERQSRAPSYYSEVMLSELFSMLIGGHDTTSTTLLWAVKLLAASQDVQQKLRSHLRSTHAAAHSEGRVPNAHEIITTQSHYLDACIEEILRCGQTTAITSRTATTDAVVLGQLIPKGTRIIMCNGGGGVLVPHFKIDDASRSKSYNKVGGGKVGIWEAEGMAEFKPDRWLVQDAATNSQVFDSTAGPHLLFGAGPRSCFGRKLAYVELRIAISLIVWSFELQPVPETYGSWEAMEILTRSPIVSHVKLAKA